MKIVEFLFNTLLSLILITGLFTLLVIAMYMLKIMLEELYDGDGVMQLLKKLKVKRSKKKNET